MSDSESTAAPPPAHPSFGGKSIETVQQQQSMFAGERKPYKSWRKKYRKMRVQFDAAFEDNRVGFRQEHKLESTARRLREELDELLEILLDLNDSPALPPNQRFDIRLPFQRNKPTTIPPDITPEGSDALIHDYTNAVKAGRIPHVDLQLIRDQIQTRLASQDVLPLEHLESSIPHPTRPAPAAADSEEGNPAYLTKEEEAAYLSRIDASLGDPLALDKTAQLPPSPHQAELTPRELERHMELLNPQSQHNWLKTHTKQVPSMGLETDDGESQHEGGKATPSGRGKGKGKGNLAKQVGDRALERAGYGGEGAGSPGGFGSGFEEDGEATPLAGFVEEFPGGSGRKKKDTDGAYRVKGGKAGGTGKRKRKTEEGGQTGAGKKPRMSEGVAE